MTTEKQAEDNATEKPPMETAGQQVGETEKNVSAAAPVTKSWWGRLMDKIMMR